MFKSKVDKKLKQTILKKLATNPEAEFSALRSLLVRDVLQEKKKEITKMLLVIKDLIKDAIPSKVKFYVLLLLKELMETRNKLLVELF